MDLFGVITFVQDREVKLLESVALLFGVFSVRDTMDRMLKRS
jgi:hypothetical protein